MLAPTVDSFVSTSGASPVTVTVSVSVAGPSCRVTASVWFNNSCSPVCVMVWKPERLAVSRCAPTRTGIRNWPCASVTASKVLPVSSWMMVMVTPGSTPPDVSVTVPVMVACCADADTAPRSRVVAASTTRFKLAFIVPPSRCPDDYYGRVCRAGRLEPGARVCQDALKDLYNLAPLTRSYPPPGRTLHTSGEHYESNDHRCVSDPGS